MRIPKTLSVLSFVFNALFIGFFVLAINTRTASFSFYAADGGYAASALVVTALPQNSVIFNPVEIQLAPGGRAALQMSAVMDGRQANWLLSPLFDHEILSVQPSGFGIVITALAYGESSLQILTETGITTIAVVRVH